MQQNIGILDRYLRLTSGLLMYAGAFQMRRYSLSRSALLALGSMKIAEGATGWCPMMYAMGIRSLEEEGQTKGTQGREAESGSASSKPHNHQEAKNQNTTQHEHEHRGHGQSESPEVLYS